MKIQVTQTLPNGQVTQQILSKEGVTSLKMQALPGAKVSFNVEAGKSNDGGTPQTKTGTVKRVGNHLVLELEGEELVEVTEFYNNTGASLGNVEWNYLATDAGGMVVTPEALAVAGGAESAALLPIFAPGLGLFAGAATVVAVANNNTNNPTAAIASTTTVVSGNITAGGPLVKGHGLTVQLYKEDGTAWGPAVAVDEKGFYTATLQVGAGEVVIAKVLDANDGVDYTDTVTHEGKDLNALLQAGGVSNGAALVLNINALTSIAVEKAGTAPDAAAILTANDDVSNAFGVGDITTLTPDVISDGKFDGTTPEGKLGAVLGAISGVDSANGGDSQKTLDDLEAGVNVPTDGKLSPEQQAVLVQGADKAEDATGVDGVTDTVVDNLETQDNTNVSINSITADNVLNAIETTSDVTSGTTVITGTNVTGATVALTFGTNPATGSVVAVTATTWKYVLTSADVTKLGADGGKYVTATATLAGGGTATSSQPFVLKAFNEAPVIAAASIALTDTSVADPFTNQTGTLSATDAQGDALTYGISGVGSGANVTVNSVVYNVSKVGTYGTLHVKSTTGEYVYVPNVTAINAVAANQTDTFAVTASDGSLTGTGNLTVNIAGANDAPVLTVPTAITLTDTVAKDTFATNTAGTLVSADAENTVRTYGITGGGAGATVGSVVYDVSKVGTYGTLHVKSTTGEYVYVANATAINALGANQTENFVVTATDGGTPVTQTLTVNVTGANDSPVWVGSSSAYTIKIGQPVSASANPGIDFADADTGHAAISYTLFSVGGIQGGTIPGVTLNANGTLTGTPTDVAAETYPKDYVVVVRAKDGNDPTLYTDHTYTIRALKDPVNEAPVIAAASIALTDTSAADPFTNQTGTLSATDAQGDALTYGISGGGAGSTVNSVVYNVSKVGTYGTLYVKSTTGEYVYVPNVTAINAVAANQTDTFAVTASDGSLTGTGNLTVNIAGANDAPVLTAPAAITLTDTVAKDTFATNTAGTLVSADAENTVRTYGITGGGAGATVGSVVYDVSKVGTYGTLHVKSTTGEYVYVANATAINALGANQTENFVVTATDGGTPVTQTLTVNVIGANDAPVLTVPAAITLTDTVAKDTFANQTGTLVSADAENTARTYGITGGGAGATVGSVVYDVSKVGTYGTLHVKSTTGEYVYVANATAINALGANQTENFVVTATDGGTPVTQTLTVNVTGANDSPVWVGSSSAYTIIIGQPVSASANPGIDFADADTGHAAISYTLFSVGGVQGGTIPGVTLNANGTLTGTPTNVAAETYPKDYVVVVRAKDGNDPTLYTDHTYSIHALKAPAVQSISVLDGTSSNTTALGKAGETLDVSVVFSEVVTVVGSPTITLSINGKTATATYNGTGTGTSTLHFTVAIPSGAGYDGSNIALTGVTANVSGVSVIGQTSGQAWDATPMPAAFTGYTVDTTMPTITSTYSVNENTLADTATKTIALAATNETGAVTWSSLAGTDATSFTLGTGANLGKLVFNGASDFEAKSSYSVTLTGTDAAGNAKTGQVVTVNINNVNEAPAVVAAIPDASADVGVAMTSINAATAFADPDSLASGMGTLTYSFVGTAPAGITIDPATGVISGTPTAAGNYNVEVKASDGTNSVIDTFALNVVSVPLLVAPLLTATQALDDVTNLDVKSALVISFDGPITLNTTGTQHIKIFDDMNSTGWNHTASAAVLNNTVVDTYNNDVDITLTNGVVTLVTVGGADLTSRFNLTTSVVVNGNNLVIDLKPAVEANHLSVAAISKASTAFDWDFGAAYHVELDADLVTRGGLGNAATTDSTVLNFTTVTPVLTTSGAVAAKMMDASGTLATLSDGYKYLNGNQGNSQATPYGATLDLSGGNYAVVLDSQGTNKTNLGGWIRIQNFSLDAGALNQTDLIYMDNHGDQSILTTNSLSVSNPSSWNNDTVITTDSIRKLNAASGGAAMWVTFETPAVSGWTKPTNDASFENATHMNYDAIIFG